MFLLRWKGGNAAVQGAQQMGSQNGLVFLLLWQHLKLDPILLLGSVLQEIADIGVAC